MKDFVLKLPAEVCLNLETELASDDQLDWLYKHTASVLLRSPHAADSSVFCTRRTCAPQPRRNTREAALQASFRYRYI